MWTIACSVGITRGRTGSGSDLHTEFHLLILLITAVPAVQFQNIYFDEWNVGCFGMSILTLTTLTTVIITVHFAGEHQDHQRQPRRGGRPPQRPGDVGESTKRENSKQQQQQPP